MSSDTPLTDDELREQWRMLDQFSAKFGDTNMVWAAHVMQHEYPDALREVERLRRENAGLWEIVRVVAAINYSGGYVNSPPYDAQVSLATILRARELLSGGNG